EAFFPLSMAADVAWRVWLGLAPPTDAVIGAWAALFERYDVVLCPISPVVAVPHDPEPALVPSVEHRLERTIDIDGHPHPYLEQMVWNIVVGTAGLPATAVPVAVDLLPIGIQVVGRPGADRTT